MRLDWALASRYAEAPGDGTLTILGAGTDTFWMQELPAPIGVFLPLRISGPQDEWEEEGHELSIRLVRPDSEEEFMLTVPLHSATAPPLKIPGAETGMVMPAVLTWEAREYGLYTLEIYVDTRRARSVPFSIRAAADLPGAVPGEGN